MELTYIKNLDEKSRQTIIHYLPSGLEGKKQSSPTLIFKVFKVAGLTELDAESRFLRHCHFLTIFVHRKGADDYLLGVLGENCPVLQVRMQNSLFHLNCNVNVHFSSHNWPKKCNFVAFSLKNWEKWMLAEMGMRAFLLQINFCTNWVLETDQ